VESTSDLRGILAKIDLRRKTLGNNLQQNAGVLKNALNIDSEIPEDILRVASEELAKIKERIDPKLKIEYNEEELGNAKKRSGEIDQKLNELEKDLKDHRTALAGFSGRAYQLYFRNFLGTDLDLSVENLESLISLKQYLKDFIQRIEEDARLSKEALIVFHELESEEQAKITELFQEGSLASQIFAEVTGGRYDQVKYDPQDEQIQAKRPSGEVFSVDMLSKATRDQLYLAIRIDLGTKILKGVDGFFIMDDAFLASDSNRLRMQMDRLKQLSDMGWQILYFTAKKEVFEALQNTTNNKPIKLPPLP